MFISLIQLEPTPQTKPITYSKEQYEKASRWGDLSTILLNAHLSTGLTQKINLPGALETIGIIVKDIFGPGVTINKIDNIRDKNDQVLFDNIYNELKKNPHMDTDNPMPFRKNSDVDFVAIVIGAGNDGNDSEKKLANSLNKLNKDERAELNRSIKQYFADLPAEEKKALNEMRLLVVSYALFKALKEAKSIDLSVIEHIDFKPGGDGRVVNVIICAGATAACMNFQISTAIIQEMRPQLIGSIIQDIQGSTGESDSRSYFTIQPLDKLLGEGAYASMKGTAKAILEAIDAYRSIIDNFTKSNVLASNSQPRIPTNQFFRTSYTNIEYHRRKEKEEEEDKKREEDLEKFA